MRDQHRKKGHADMRTSKPFSTISYNTEDYLTAKLDELVTTRKIEFYAFIEHSRTQYTIRHITALRKYGKPPKTV